MQKLKQDVIEATDQINQSWVEAIKKAEKEDVGLDLTDVISKFSKIQTELMIKLNQAEERMKKNKGFFK